MARRLLYILFAFCLSFSVEGRALASSSVEIIEQDMQPVGISTVNSTLHITNAAGQVVHIYSITGERLMSFRVDGDDKRFDLPLQRGCYIVKVGKVVRKISIR